MHSDPSHPTFEYRDLTCNTVFMIAGYSGFLCLTFYQVRILDGQWHPIVYNVDILLFSFELLSLFDSDSDSDDTEL